MVWLHHLVVGLLPLLIALYPPAMRLPRLMPILRHHTMILPHAMDDLAHHTQSLPHLAMRYHAP